jgi:hypothetical protein
LRADHGETGVVDLEKTRTAATRAWERRVGELKLACTCWDLRSNGITPHREARARYRTDATCRTFQCDKGHVV